MARKRYNIWLEQPKIGGWAKRTYRVYDTWYHRSWTGSVQRNWDLRKLIGRDRYDHATIHEVQLFEQPHEYPRAADRPAGGNLWYWLDAPGKYRVRATGAFAPRIGGDLSTQAGLISAYAVWTHLGYRIHEAVKLEMPHDFPRPPIRRKLRMRT